MLQAGAGRARDSLQECLDLAFLHPDSMHAVGLAAEAVQSGLVKLSTAQRKVGGPLMSCDCSCVGPSG